VQDILRQFQQLINLLVNCAFSVFISCLPFYLFRRTSRPRTVVIPDKIDKGHWSWHLQIARPGVIPIILLQMYDTAIIPCLLLLLILGLDDGRSLDCALLEEAEAFTALYWNQ
jgi:hypothetical protein